jgi:hypothetical protein
MSDGLAWGVLFPSKAITLFGLLCLIRYASSPRRFTASSANRMHSNPHIPGDGIVETNGNHDVFTAMGTRY